MNRQQFEALKPTLGHTAIYKIFALQSDYFISQHHMIPAPLYLPIPAHIQDQVDELIDSIELYHATRSTNVELYLSLIKDVYSGSNIWNMSTEIAARVIAVNPNHIKFINSKYLNTQTYLDYIKANGLDQYVHIAKFHFRNKEFLFHVWNLFPKLLHHPNLRSLFTSQRYNEFITLYPESKVRELYMNTVEIRTPIITEESLRESLDNNIIPKGKIPKKLFTPENIERLINIEYYYMLSDYCLQFVTKEIFIKHYLSHPHTFSHYLDSELLAASYRKDQRFYLHKIELYPDDIIMELVADDNSYIAHITDPFLIAKLVSGDSTLAKYVTPYLQAQALATRKKSANFFEYN